METPLQRRLRPFLPGIILIFLGIFFFTFDDLFYYILRETLDSPSAIWTLLFKFLSLTLGFMGAIALLYGYLNGAFIISDDSRTHESSSSLKRSVEKLSLEFKDLKENYKRLLESSTSPAEGNQLDINEVIDSIRDQVITELPDKTLKAFEQKFASKISDGVQIDLVRNGISETASRLQKEIADSGRRSNVNLLIGVGTTLFAAGILAYISFETKPTFENITSLLAHYLPRLTTIIFVEVFAFFFLRLYKAGQQEIRYYQNELTNIEMQKAALEASLVKAPTKTMDGIVQQLVRTERNLAISKITDDGNSSLNIGPKEAAALVETLSKLTGKG